MRSPIQTSRQSATALFDPAVSHLTALVCAGIATMHPDVAVAQSMALDLPSADDVLVHDTGWGLLLKTRELLLFLFDALVTVMLTAAIAYHPVSMAERKTVGDLELPVLLFVYGLIGMTVGFLVIHHGYLIGFVIFGIGGLLRFRTSGESARETMRMILVTVVGLCVGLDVPPMAIFVAGIAWVVIYLHGRTERHNLEVKFADEKKLHEGSNAIREIINRFGGRIVAQKQARFKPTVEFVFTVKRDVGTDGICSELYQLRGKKTGLIMDWYLQ